MFATIRRHQSWLLAVVVAITIVSFIIWGWGKNAGNPGRTVAQGEYGSIGGRAISPEQVRDASAVVALDYFFNRGSVPDLNSPEVRYEAYIHLFFEAKMHELGIDVTPAAAAQFFKQASRMFTHNFSDQPLSMDQIEHGLLEPKGFSLADFDRLLKFDCGREQLVSLVAAYGTMVTPQEADADYRYKNQEFATSMALFAATNFLASVPANPAEEATYYTNHVSTYRVPEKVQIEFVKFNVTNYFAAAEKSLTNLDAIVDENVSKMGTNLFQGTKNPEESRIAIRKRIILEKALPEARRDASKFAQEVYAIEPKTSANLRALAAKKGLAVEAPAAFDRENGPQDSTTPMALVRPAFSCSADEPFSPAVTTEDGSYVLAQTQLTPSFVPSFEIIKKKVSDDYRHFQALILAQQASIKLYYNFMTNALPAGKTFASACADAKVTLESLPPFSLSTGNLTEKYEDRVDLRALKEAAFTTPVGMPSQPRAARDGVFILFVDKALPFNEVKVKADMPEHLLTLRQARQNSAFYTWLNLQIFHDTQFYAFLQQLRDQAQPKSVRAAKS